eukprot:862513-Rhodomonas_salina.1
MFCTSAVSDSGTWSTLTLGLTEQDRVQSHSCIALARPPTLTLTSCTPSPRSGTSLHVGRRQRACREES